MAKNNHSLLTRLKIGFQNAGLLQKITLLGTLASIIGLIISLSVIF